MLEILPLRPKNIHIPPPAWGWPCISIDRGWGLPQKKDLSKMPLNIQWKLDYLKIQSSRSRQTCPSNIPTSTFLGLGSFGHRGSWCVWFALPSWITLKLITIKDWLDSLYPEHSLLEAQKRLGGIKWCERVKIQRKQRMVSAFKNVNNTKFVTWNVKK